MPRKYLPIVLAARLWVALNLSGAEPPVASLTVRDAKAVEAAWLGVRDWDQLGVFELRRSGDTNREVKVFFEVSGTARRQIDYLLLPGEQWFPCSCERPEINFRDNFIALPAGQSLILLGVRALRDYRVEGAESVVVKLLDDMSGTVPPSYSVGDARAATITIADESYRFHLDIAKRDERTLAFGLGEGSLVIGYWDLELSHDLRSWQAITRFSPGNVAAFAEDILPQNDPRPRFYRAVLTQPPETAP